MIQPCMILVAQAMQQPMRHGNTIRIVVLMHFMIQVVLDIPPHITINNVVQTHFMIVDVMDMQQHTTINNVVQTHFTIVDVTDMNRLT